MKNRSSVIRAPRGSGRLHAALLVSTLLSALVLLSSCVTNTSPATNAPLSITFTQAPPSSIATGGQVMIIATLSRDGGNAGVDWQVSCSAAKCGSFSPAHTPNGTPTTYTAPMAVPSGGTVNITATSHADKSVSVTVSPMIVSSVSISFSQAPPGTLQVNGQATVSATVTNDPSNQGVDWTVTCGGSNCGSYLVPHTASGIPTTYTAPASVPPGNTVTLTATSTADSTKSTTATVTITAPVISISFSQSPPSSMQTNAMATVSAIVMNDLLNEGVDWSVSCTGNNCGGFNPMHTASGAPTTFTAPPVIPPGNTVTITAKSTADPTKFVTANVTITGVNSVSITFTQAPPASMLINAQAMMSATVMNDPANKGVDWGVTCNGASCGGFTPMHTASGVLTTYMAPPAIPTGGTVTITATATADPTKTVSSTVTITAPVISIAFTISPPPSMQVGTTAMMSATVTNDSQNLGVDWTVSCNANNCGGFTPTHTASAAPTSYMAPPTVPTGGTVTITAKATADPSMTVSATVTINPAVSIVFTVAPPTSMQINAMAMMSATVSNDPLNLGVDWSVTCTGGGCGFFTPTHTASGALTNYNSPPAIPTGGTVTITATATADPTMFVTATVTITSSSVSISFVQEPPGTLQIGKISTMSAIVSGDPAMKGVDWSVSCNGSCGSFNPAHTASGVATTYTAPASVPTGNIVTITAASTAVPAQTVTATVTIANASTIGLLNGKYAFSFSGQDVTASGFYAVVGSLTADGNGNITSGEEDFTDLLTVPFTATFTGTYTIGSDGRGMMTLNTNNVALGVNGVQTLSFVVVTAQNVLITEFDSSATSTGSMGLQNPGSFSLASVTGSYSFTFTGNDLSSGGLTFIGGVLTADGNGNITSGTEDVNDSGAVSNTPISGSYLAPDSFGRGTATIGSSTYVYYVVNPGEVEFLETDNFFISSGFAFAQGSAAFTDASLPATNPFALTLLGSGSAGALVAGAIVQFDGNGNITSGTIDVNNFGTQTTASPFGGTYHVSSNGRGTLTLTGNTGGLVNFAVYFTANQGVLILELDSSHLSDGVVLAQSGGISGATFKGNYGLLYGGTDKNLNPEGIVGQAVADGVSGITGNVDINIGQTLNPAVALTGTFVANSNGRFTGTLKTSVTGQLAEIFYVVNSSTVLFIEVDSKGETSGVLQLQQ